MHVVEETRSGTWLTQPLVSIREALDNHQSLAPAYTRSQVSWLVSVLPLLISAQNPKRACSYHRNQIPVAGSIKHLISKRKTHLLPFAPAFTTTIAPIPLPAKPAHLDNVAA
jgi:hypothetical protein